MGSQWGTALRNAQERTLGIPNLSNPAAGLKMHREESRDRRLHPDEQKLHSGGCWTQENCRGCAFEEIARSSQKCYLRIRANEVLQWLSYQN
jgi:hypothetical protein